jgi:hypothetical protein
MAGGYGRVIEDTVALQVNTLRLAFEHWHQWSPAAHLGAVASRSA